MSVVMDVRIAAILSDTLTERVGHLIEALPSRGVPRVTSLSQKPFLLSLGQAYGSVC